MNDAIVDALTPHCAVRSFAPGETLRMRGGFAPEMLLILEGRVDINLAPGGDKKIGPAVGPRSIIGEIGFLTSKGATAEVTTTTPVRALAIDRSALAKLEADSPALAAEFSRELARSALTRLQSDQVALPEMSEEIAETMEIVMCSKEGLLHTAQRVRYDVYCGEHGRPSLYARHDEKVIIDELDEHGASFLAMQDGTAIGTSRVSLTRDGNLGMLPNIYGMAHSAHYPEHASIITKYAIRDAFRGGTTYIRLFGAMATYIMQSNIKEIFIDCVPPLARFYATMGFKQCAEEFIHYENGLSVPMVLDVVAYNDKMSIEERYRRNRWRW